MLQVTDKFAHSIETVLLDSMSTADLNTTYVIQLGKAMYAPYLPYISNYGKLEAHYLVEQLNSIELVGVSMKAYASY